LKYEFPGIGGEVEDIAWDNESKRIVAVGGGQSKAKIFSWDTGSNLASDIIPHSKKNLSADFRSERPFKVVFGGEDFQMSFYQGPPFKYEKGLKDHTNFVNCIRYAPDGSKFVSVSSDKQGLVFDGVTAEKIGKLDPTTIHSGSIYSCSWSSDSKKLVTSSADKTLKLWDLSTAESGVYKCEATFSIGSKPEDMQNSVVWPAKSESLVSLSLDGSLNYVSLASKTVSKKIEGHKEAIAVFSYDAKTSTFITGDLGGRVCIWKSIDETNTRFVAKYTSGEIPTKKLSGVSIAGDVMTAVSWDDKLRLGDAVTGEFKKTISLPGQPKGVATCASNPSLHVVVTGSSILVVLNETAAAPVAVSWGPTCVDINEAGNLVAIGGNDKKVHIYSLEGTSLTQVGETAEAPAAISVVAISPKSDLISAGDALREVRLYDTKGATKVASRWMNHTTRVTGLKWSPDGKYIVTVASDRRLCFWDPSSDFPVKSIDLAHPAPFAGVVWCADSTIWTLGIDGIVARRVVAL
jgi:WD repeat-containing protein 1 (actin-interacting protein 1)